MIRIFIFLSLVCFISCNGKTKEKNDENKSVQNTVEKFNWKEYKYKEGDFLIQFPGKPEKEEETVQSTKSWGNVKTHSFLYSIKDGSDKNVVYQATYNILQNTINADSIEYFFDDLASMLVYNIGDNGKLISNSRIYYKTFPGREVHIEMKSPEAIGVFKYYLVNKKYYSVQVMAYKGNYPNGEMDHFFNSFKLLKEE